jgi:hypothetical protein
MTERMGAGRLRPRPSKALPVGPIAVLLLTVFLPSVACRPGEYSLPPEAVAFLHPYITEHELQGGHFITLQVRSEESLSVVEINVRMPDGVRPVTTPSHFDDSWFRRGAARNSPRASIRRTHGEIPSGESELLHFAVQGEEVTAGDVLSFPVELTLSDSSLVRWDAPPGSERPAPALVVRRDRGVGIKPVLVFVGLALIPLLTAGAWKVRQGMRMEQ